MICSTWEYCLQMQSPRYFILTRASWRIFAIKGGMSIFHILRVFSMGHDFFSKLDSTCSSVGSNISVVLSLFTLSFEYVVAETISYHKCALYFSIRCRDHAHISLAKRDLRIPFSVYVYSLWEMFWYIGNALDFRPRGPWFESGRLQQFLGGLSMTDHLLISLEFSFFISFFILY